MTPAAEHVFRSPRGFGPQRWLPGYDRETFKSDLMAGLTVAVMIIPQSMAYAHLAGVPAIFGLYASVVPLLVYALVGTSLHLAVGVIAIDMLLLRAGLQDLDVAMGSTEYVQLAVLLTLLVGLIQLAMGLARLGFLVNLLSRPVMIGFTSGAALLIVASQVGPLAGVEVGGAQVLPTMVLGLFRELGELHTVPLLFGSTAVLLLLTLRRVAPKVPGAMVVVALGTAAVALGVNPPELALVGEVPAGLPTFVIPAVTGARIQSLIPTAVVLALIQFLTVASLGKVFAARFRYRVGHNRELLAIGASNLAGSFFRGLPISGSFSRTAVNVEVGAQTPMANVVTAVSVAFCLLFLTPVLGLVPIPVLGAMIVVAAIGLLDIKEMRFLLRAKTVDGWIAVLTFMATILLGILEGIGVGVAASILAILLRIGRPHIVVLGHLHGTRSFRDVRKEARAKRVDGVLLLRVDASFSFMNAEFLRDVILDRTAREHPGVEAVVIDASSINDLDTTAAHVLLGVAEILSQRNVDLYLGGARTEVQGVLERSGLNDGPDFTRFHLSPHRAVRYALARRGSSTDYMKNVPGSEADVAETDGPPT